MLSRARPQSRQPRRRARGWLLPLVLIHVIYVIPWLSSLEVFVGDPREALEELGFSFHELSGHNFTKVLVQTSASEKRRVAAGAALAGAAAGAVAGAVVSNRVMQQSQSTGYAPCLIGSRKPWEDGRKPEMGQQPPTGPEPNLSANEQALQHGMTKHAPYPPTKVEYRDGADGASDTSSQLPAAAAHGAMQGLPRKHHPEFRAADTRRTDSNMPDTSRSAYQTSRAEPSQTYSMEVHAESLDSNDLPDRQHPQAAPNAPHSLNEGVSMNVVSSEDVASDASNPSLPNADPQLNGTWPPVPAPAPPLAAHQRVWQTRGKLAQGAWQGLKQIRTASEADLASNSEQVARRALEVASVVCSFTQGMATMSSKLLEEAARDTQRTFQEAASKWHSLRQRQHEWTRSKSVLSQLQNSTNASSR
mmetsp:Transcript_56064/g.103755  ORF Transcript_56064/g.103755 Transcript_56064/m.103755 type:complete len:418 (+) Transcript_56064:115-1368(+)